MNKTRKRMLLVSAWLLSVGLANYLGGVIGYRQGTATELTLSGNDAFETAIVLRELRDGHVERAIAFLETKLDAQISAGVFGEHAYDSPYNVMQWIFGDRVAGNAWAFSEVLRYRDEHPSTSDERVRAKMMPLLEAYRDAPAPAHVQPRE